MATEILRPIVGGDVCTIEHEGGCGVCPGHYACVDEASPDTDTFVYSWANAWRYDLYALPNPSLEGIITNVAVTVRLWTDPGDNTDGGRLKSYGRTVIKTEGTEYRGTTYQCSTTWTNRTTNYANNPHGGAWTWDQINALQIGVGLDGDHETNKETYISTAWCTQVYVVVTYTPVVAPTVTAQAATDKEATTATGNGNITDNGGENCDIRGVVWDLGSHGDPGNVAPGASGYANDVAETDSFGTGAFTRSLTGLPPGTTIYYRTYAHNSAGYDYSNTEISFLTKPAAPTNVVASDNLNDKVTITWAKATGATGYQIYRDGTPLGWLGDVATGDDSGAGAPSITPGDAVAGDGASTAHVSLSISGEGTSNGTTHTYKVRAKNATGESVDSGTDTGKRIPGALTYQWQRSAGDSDASYGNIGGTTEAYNDTAAPAPTITPGTASASDGTYNTYVRLALAGESANVGAGRYYRCVLNAPGCTQQITGTNRGYRGVGALTRQWQRSAGDSDTSYGNISGATSDPYNDTAAPAPTITKGTVTGSDGTYPEKVRLDASDYSTSNGAGRYYRCYLTATGASPQYSTTNRGYRSPGTLYRQWQKSAADSDASYSNINGATSDPYDYTGAPAPTVTPGTASASDGSSTAHVTLSLAGESANIGAGRYYRAMYTAAGCTTQYTSGNRGYRGVGAIGRQWYRSAGDSDEDYGVLGGATTDPYNDTTAPAPTITPGEAAASDGLYSTHVALSLSGHSTSVGDGRYYKCLVSATGAASQYSTANRGYRGVGALTYQWQRSAADSDADYGNIDGATTDPYNDTGAPGNGQGRWYLCLLNATGAAQAESTHDRGYRWMGGKTAHMSAKMIGGKMI